MNVCVLKYKIVQSVHKKYICVCLVAQVDDFESMVLRIHCWIAKDVRIKRVWFTTGNERFGI